MNSVASKHAFKDVRRNATTGRATWRSIQRVSVPIRKKTVDPPASAACIPRRSVLHARPSISLLVHTVGGRSTCGMHAHVQVGVQVGSSGSPQAARAVLLSAFQYARTHQSCFVPRTQPWTHGAVKPKRASHVRGNSLPQLLTRVCEQTIVVCFSCTSSSCVKACRSYPTLGCQLC